MIRPGFWQRLDLWAQRLWPFTVSFLLVLIGTVPLPLPYWQPVGPGFGLIAAYYWAIHAPNLMPLPAIFLLGLFGDFFGWAPLGVGTLVLVLAYMTTLSQRRIVAGKPFHVVWWGFMMVAAGAMALAWGATSLLAVAVVDPRPALFSYLVTLAVYPAVGWLFARVQRSLPRVA